MCMCVFVSERFYIQGCLKKGGVECSSVFLYTIQIFYKYDYMISTTHDMSIDISPTMPYMASVG